MIHRRAIVKANSIRLKRSQHQGAFLLVEGRDDRMLMRRFVCATTCSIQVMEGKHDVLDVVHILTEQNFMGVLGMVDADFGRVVGAGTLSINLVMSDGHDLETMLLMSTALEDVLSEFGSQAKIDSLEEGVWQIITNLALPLARLRLYANVRGLPLRFEGINYSSWLPRAEFVADIDLLIQEVKNRSQRPDLSDEALKSAILETEGLDHDVSEMCNGHDLIAILSIGLRNKFGSNSAQAVEPEKLGTALRLAYRESSFRATNLFHSIAEWESSSGGFGILRK